MVINYNIEFKATEPIYSTEYSIKILPEEFNHSMNYTLRCFPTSSGLTLPEDSASFLENPWLCPQYTSSDFQPYITEINLYQNGVWDGPVIQAKLPKPLVTSDETTITLKIKLDT